MGGSSEKEKKKSETEQDRKEGALDFRSTHSVNSVTCVALGTGTQLLTCDRRGQMQFPSGLWFRAVSLLLRKSQALNRKLSSQCCPCYQNSSRAGLRLERLLPSSKALPAWSFPL